MNYDIIREYYDMGLFGREDIELFARVGYLTQAQADDILAQITEEVPADAT